MEGRVMSRICRILGYAGRRPGKGVSRAFFGRWRCALLGRTEFRLSSAELKYPPRNLPSCAIFELLWKSESVT